MKYTSLVNPFHGCGLIELPKAQGIAKSWYFIKALYGNTHPGATLPFGKYSVCPFSAGYSSGYGTNVVDPEKYVPNDTSLIRLRGFSHFQHSGAGFMGMFYNYAVTTPYYGEKHFNYAIKDEYAQPGYYCVTLKETDIFCELSVCENAALHRYTFRENGGKISVDFTNDGLHMARMRAPAEDPVVTVTDEKTLSAEVTLRGVRMYFVMRFEGDGALNSDGVFEMSSSGTVTAFLSASAQSRGDALNEAEKAKNTDFDTAREKALEEWEKALSKIELQSDDKTELEIFYSNMYHTLVKPCDWNGGGFLWEGAPFVTDFSTLWDMYKTQLPLVYTLFPEISEKIAETFKKYAEVVGRMPHSFTVAKMFNNEDQQARLNAVHTLYDAYRRGIKGDWENILSLMVADIYRDAFRDYTENGACARTTHTLDMSEGCHICAEMSRDFGLTEQAEKLEKLAENVKNAFDPETGLLLEDSVYYEGTHYNYSFRPLHNMEKRIDLCGKEKFEQYLDRFFGFTDPCDLSARFEGFNNDSDMEAPYAYAYIGRQDKICQIIDAADKYMYRQYDGGTGRGGLPGNNDAGGMTSCYIWNTLGIFPVSGQDLMFIVRPKFEKATLHLSYGKMLEIKRIGDGKYPVSARFNGVRLDGLSISASDLMQGGELEIMC